VEYAIVKWVDWFNNRWLLESSIWIMITSGFSIYAMTDIATFQTDWISTKFQNYFWDHR